jgi:RNA polymerase sigma factor (sigma-70 family)
VRISVIEARQHNRPTQGRVRRFSCRNVHSAGEYVWARAPAAITEDVEASALPRARVLAPRSRRLLAALGDERLVEQLRRGNDAAFEAIYDRHHRGILAFCRHMLGSQEEAEDAVQHAFAAAYTDLRKDDREIRLKAWLYTIARNRCLSILRARREQPTELDDKIATAGLAESVQQRADLRELLGDLGRLPDDQREALVLFEIGDLSHKEIGAVIGVEPVKVKALVFQARSALIEQRDARAIPCAEIREQLATATGGALRRGPLRRHLKSCPGCSQYRDQVKEQRRALAALLPVVPSAALKGTVLAAAGIGGGAGGAGLAAGGAALSGAAAGTSGGICGAVGAAKIAIGAAAIAAPVAAGGLAVGHHHQHHAHKTKPPVAVHATKPRVKSSVSQSSIHSTAPAPKPSAPQPQPVVAGVPKSERAKSKNKAAVTRKKHARGKHKKHWRGHSGKHHWKTRSFARSAGAAQRWHPRGGPKKWHARRSFSGPKGKSHGRHGGWKHRGK